MSIRTVPLARLFEAFNCDPETGEFTWRTKPNPHTVVGSRAGTNCRGYRVLMLDKVPLSAHRAVWAFVHGSWPDAQIDHINGDGMDNRIANLRLAKGMGKQQGNRRLNRNNTSGLRGVIWDKRKGMWAAVLKRGSDKSPAHLGYFKEKTDAAKAYEAEARRYFGEFYAVRP